MDNNAVGNFNETMQECIIYINVCLKKWRLYSKNSGKFRGYTDRRSMILSWLNRAYMTHYHIDKPWRHKNDMARTLGRFMDFTVYDMEDDIYITSVTVPSNSLLFEKLESIDYKEMNRRANNLVERSPSTSEVKHISFGEIESIKFTT